MFIAPPSTSASSMPLAPPNTAPTTPNSATMPAIRIVVLSQLPNIPVFLAKVAIEDLRWCYSEKIQAVRPRQAESGEELGRRQLLAAGTLQFQQTQRPGTAGHDDALAPASSIVPGRPRRTQTRAPDLESDSSCHRRGARQRIEGAHLALDHRRGLAPIDLGLRLGDLCGVACARCRLGSGAEFAAFDLGEHLHDQACAEFGKLVVQARTGVFRCDWKGLGGKDGTGIQAAVHLHDGYAGERVAGKDGALNWRRAAPARQERGVDIDRAQPGHGEHRLGQDQSVGCDHQGIRASESRRASVASSFRLAG